MLNKLRNIPLIKFALGCFAVNIIFIVLTFVIRGNLPPVIPIYFGLARGVEQLGPSSALGLPPLLALAISIINTAIAVFSKDILIQRILIALAALATLLSSITFVKIALLVGSF